MQMEDEYSVEESLHASYNEVVQLRSHVDESHEQLFTEALDDEDTKNIHDKGLEIQERRKENLVTEDETRIQTHSDMETIKQEKDYEAVPLAGSAPDFTLWTVEDDLLLKNAMEAGAAMEALAKGAFRFSRRYTVWEIRERWRALLYDPDISAKAAADMVKVENLARMTQQSRMKDLEELMRERKLNSVRTHYYKMIKHNVFENDSNFLLQNYVHRELDKMQSDATFSQEKKPLMEDDACRFMTNFLAAGVNGSVPSKEAPADSLEIPESLDNGIIENEKFQFGPITDLGIGEAAISGNPLGIEGMNEKQDTDGADATSIKSLLSPKKTFPLNEAYQDKHGRMSGDASQQTSTISISKYKRVIQRIPESELSESDIYSDGLNETITAACKPSTTSVYSVVGMVCVLNTEDTDIPSPPCSEGEIHSATLSPVYSPLGLDMDEIDCNLRGEQPDNLDDSQTLSESMFPIPEDNWNVLMEAGDCAGMSHDRSHLMCSCDGERNNSFAATSTFEVNPASFPLVNNARREAKEKISINRNNSQAVSCGNSYPEHCNRTMEHIPSMTGKVERSCQSDQIFRQKIKISDSMNRLQSCNNGFLESDEEMAKFSDVETMIMDMDLDPGQDEILSARAESRRFYKKHWKAIVRLEQGVNAALQRRLTRHGALAFLYGHHLRYFITQNEVTLGRVTQDSFVDIDLGKEGRANKVSRLQASIKLKEDGAFYLKNLGRRPITVNGKFIETSQRAIIGSNCLIEVGGMRFIFGINKKLVEEKVEQMIYARNHMSTSI